MTKSKHTPGPWMAASKASSIVGLPVVAKTGRSIASVTFFNLGERFDHHEQESYANARLIAAAPGMLAALKEAADFMSDIARDHHPNWRPEMCDPDSVLGKVYAAIARAEGRSEGGQDV